MNRHFRNLSIAIASGAALAVAAAVIAEVPDDEWYITDKKESVTKGYVRVEGDSYQARAETLCAPTIGGDTPDGTYIEFSSRHPDGVKLKKDKGAVEQSQKDNQARLYISTGSGTAQRGNTLVCDKIEVSGDIKTNKTPAQGSFQGSAKNCVCDTDGENDCADYPAQIAQAAFDCADLQTIKGDFKDGVVKKISINGKGDAELD